MNEANIGHIKLLSAQEELVSLISHFYHEHEEIEEQRRNESRRGETLNNPTEKMPRILLSLKMTKRDLLGSIYLSFSSWLVFFLRMLILLLSDI